MFQRNDVLSVIFSLKLKVVTKLCQVATCSIPFYKSNQLFAVVLSIQRKKEFYRTLNAPTDEN